ncbi:hypothetical protein OPKNFCMD_6371 [Methylobacterium crusticola]|uniref:CHAT domain-containing protein n=1 Tax=Methylobacterium crusticola TaxID=1697972 RepID=A0ABQ4R8Q8_9HYPH|nr:CHAT domain-containing protein [Methylobacterium crusticola]GJD53594.1 hypothetical protein OPKNFCMD_6371 [Methylobacterium crusticola]
MNENLDATWGESLVAAAVRCDKAEIAALLPPAVRNSPNSLNGGYFLLEGIDAEARLLGSQLLVSWLRARGDACGAAALALPLLTTLLGRAEVPLVKHAALQLSNVAGVFASVVTDIGQPASTLAIWPALEAGLRRVGLDGVVVTLAAARAELLLRNGQYERADRLVRRLSGSAAPQGEEVDAFTYQITVQRLASLRERFVRRPDEFPKADPGRTPDAPPRGSEAQALIVAAQTQAAALDGARHPYGAISTLASTLFRFAASHDPPTLSVLLPPLQALVSFCAAHNFADDERTARWLETVFLRRIGALDEAAAGLRTIRDGVEAQRLRIDDPHLRAAAGIGITHLYAVSAQVLYDLKQHGELFAAIEEAKSRILTDLVSAAEARHLLDPAAPRARVACSAEALLGELRAVLAASSLRAHYLTLLADDGVTYAVLVDADGELHAWRAALGRAAMLETASQLETLLRGDRQALARPKPGILSAPDEAQRWPFDAVLNRVAPLLAPLNNLLECGTLREGDVLCVSPDGPGFGLPWAALPLAETPLADRLIPVLVPSARALLAAFDQSRAHDPRGGADIVQAPHGGESLAALEGFEQEAAALARLAPTALHRGGAASFRALEGLDLRGGVVHFAAHGEFKPRAPLDRSGLALPEPDGRMPESEDRLAECRLTGARASRLALAGSHVTLRACVSGSVSEIAGREALGMIFGLWQAGVQSVLAGQWDLNLRSSVVLGEAFYNIWLRSDLSRATAYAGAMRAVREAEGSAAWAHPYHWAGLTLWGWWD